MSTRVNLSTAAVVVGFHCDAISCEVGRRGVRHWAADASAMQAVCLTSILDRGHFSLVTPPPVINQQSFVVSMSVSGFVCPRAYL